MIGIGSWRPDIAESNGSVARRALNVLLSKDESGLAHNPMPGLAVATSATALPGDPKGGVSVVDNDGAYSVVCGTDTALWRLVSDYTWLALASSYSLPPGDVWSFARFGANLFASNRSDGILKYDVHEGGAVTAVAGAPKARFIFPAFNALFALDCDGSNRTMRNSALGNATIWSGKGAGSQSFSDGEELICAAELNGDFVVVWQRNAIRGLYRRSDSKLYDAKLLYSGRGCVNPRAMANVDGRAFFVDTDGFYMIGTDGSLSAIGKDKVSKTFLERLGADGLDTVEATVDKVNSRIVFMYQSTAAASSTNYRDGVAYDYDLGEWTELELTTKAIFNMASPAITLDAMDAIYGPLDSINIPLDSRAFSGGEPRLAGLDSARRLGFFDGLPLASISESSSKISMTYDSITSVTPITDGQNARVAVGVRARLADTIAWKPAAPMQRSGRVPCRASGKIMTFQLTYEAGEQWSTMRGFDGFEMTKGAGR